MLNLRVEVKIIFPYCNINWVGIHTAQLALFLVYDAPLLAFTNAFVWIVIAMENVYIFVTWWNTLCKVWFKHDFSLQPHPYFMLSVRARNRKSIYKSSIPRIYSNLPKSHILAPSSPDMLETCLTEFNKFRIWISTCFISWL